MPDFTIALPHAFAVAPAGAVPQSEDAWLVASGLTPAQWLALGLAGQRAALRQAATAGNVALTDAQAEAIAARVTGQLAALTTTASPPLAPTALPATTPEVAASLPPPPDRSDAALTCQIPAVFSHPLMSAPLIPAEMARRPYAAVPAYAMAPAGQVTAPPAATVTPGSYAIPLKDAGIPFMLALVTLGAALYLAVDVPTVSLSK